MTAWLLPYLKIIMSYVRCSSCQARRTLAKTITDYIRLPRCRRCDHNHYYVDHYRTTVERGKSVKPCQCHRTGVPFPGLYWFPHRKGSKWCAYADFSVEQAEKWAKDRGLA